MLVFCRKQGETFSIGENIHVRIVEIRGGRAKIAIEAPAKIAIRRGELLLPTAASNQKSTER